MADLGQSDFAALRERAQHLSDHLQGVQRDIAATRAEGHAAGGLITATVAADGRLLDLSIDPSAINPEDAEGLAGQIRAAVEEAHRNAQELRDAQLGQVSGRVNGLIEGIRSATTGAFGARVAGFAAAPPPTATAAGASAASRPAPSAVPAPPVRPQRSRVPGAAAAQPGAEPEPSVSQLLAALAAARPRVAPTAFAPVEPRPSVPGAES
ncbi:YbaB/EbfC family nucleoid-associated protein [Kitasatospora cinereorecta]|uniref:Nucleoid-associated protein ACFPZF_18135 n=1 Tax=Kitasatospora cinereorecta TaxID=285560 RepID=A0ABW0VBM3_9ACTN